MKTFTRMKELLLALALASPQLTWADDVKLQDDADGTKYVNMPQTGTNTLTLNDASVQFFKVYDDGGKLQDPENPNLNNYSNYCDGYLVITAPAGYRLMVAGTIATETCDYLTIYDGTTTEAPQLLTQKASSPNSGDVNDIGSIVSSGQSLMLYFYSDRSATYSGLDLDVILYQPEKANAITINAAEGGVLKSDKTIAKYGEQVTLTWTHETGYVLESISVTNAYGRPVNITGGAWYNAATHFDMPASAVTVTPKFIKATTSLDGLAVKMPNEGTRNCDIATGVKSFKVYDDGGPYIDEENKGEYSNNCDGYLVVTAPEGYRLQLTGVVTGESCDYLTVYDGSNVETPVLGENLASKENYQPYDIGIITSTGQSMTFYFHSDYSNVSQGLDLEVTIFDPNEEYPVNIVTLEGGTLASDKAKAKFGETITLTETHQDGYVLRDVSVIDVNGRSAEVTGGTWHNVVGTFTMPASIVTVTPTFIPAVTKEDGLFINMPKEGTFTTNISSGVKSFKVYDNGGKDGEYSNSYDGYLVLTVPAGYRMQVTGIIDTEHSCDYVSIYDGFYDGTDSETPVLISQKSSTITHEPDNLGTATSTGNCITIFFHSDGTQTDDGLDLNVYVFNSDEPHAITIETATGGVMTSDVATAKFGETVTLTETHQRGYALLKTSAKDANGTEVEITGGTWYNAAASFAMPIADAIVTPTFTTATTAADGLYINMPKEGVITTDICNGIKSFKVYDNGGPRIEGVTDGNYSDNCDGTLVLTAPIGYMLKLSGTVSSEAGYDHLTIYDGAIAEGTPLLSEKSSTNSHQAEEIGEFASTGRSLTLYFRSDGSNSGFGLDLTVTLIPITYTLAFDNGKAGATGTMDITGAMESITLTYDDPKPLPAVGFSRTAYDFTGWAKAVNDTVFYADKAEVENLASVQGTEVTLFAKWKPIVYEITYDLAGGALPEGVTNPATYDIESADFTLANPTKRGYTFTGWEGTDLTEKTVNVTVATGHYGKRAYTATWQVIEYTIGYDLAGGQLPEGKSNPEKYTIESDDITLINPVREGYTFEGWKGTGIEGAVMEVTIAANSIGNRTYTATWKPITYTISYDAAEGTLAEDNPTEYTIESDDITLKKPTRTGYDFAGWTGTDLTDATETVVIAKGSIGNREYTATWTPTVYTIDYDLAGGTVATENPVEYTIESDDITLANPVREGFEFVGWTGTDLTDATETVVIAKGCIGNREYTATWRLQGDADGNEVLDLNDVKTIMAVIAGTETDEATKARADVNGDSRVDIADVIAVVNLLGKK